MLSVFVDTVAWIALLNVNDALHRQALQVMDTLRQRHARLITTDYSQRLDKDWGLTDCTSFVVLNQERITQVFTSDHHFEQAGFSNLLSHK